MQSKVRNYFKESALEADDAVLFTIPTTTFETAIDMAEPHPALNGIHYSIDDRNVRTHVFRHIMNNVYFRWFILAYIVVGILVAQFAVPPQYVLLFGFLMLFTLTFFVIFLVEMGRAVIN